MLLGNVSDIHGNAGSCVDLTRYDIGVRYTRLRKFTTRLAKASHDIGAGQRKQRLSILYRFRLEDASAFLIRFFMAYVIARELVRVGVALDCKSLTWSSHGFTVEEFHATLRRRNP